MTARQMVYRFALSGKIILMGSRLHILSVCSKDLGKFLSRCWVKGVEVVPPFL